ncbi:tRNA guanosine(34) transglycosylase Tgt [bacterium]|nr:tRNA guanosine(34) transglycosylase Tgt [bacterium]
MKSSADHVKPFTIQASDKLARSGLFRTAHGDFKTPAFMPVGTQATVKALTPAMLKEAGAEIILSNTYHLHLRPGEKLIQSLGGLHDFMGWHGPILTDSGGFQVFSLAKLRKITAQGVEFQSHHDGTKVFFSPEKVLEIQADLGVDLLMILDECPAHTLPKDAVRKSLELTLDWARRSKLHYKRKQNFILGIIQGGLFDDLRIEAAERMALLDFDAYAIGGVSVGEDVEDLNRIVAVTAPRLPTEKLRYVMGLGSPAEMLLAIQHGVDLFDCVIPTRSARFGRAYTSSGTINLRNSRFRAARDPIEETCDCYCCRNFSAGYISHLIHAQEILGITLTTLHNISFFQNLMKRAQEAIHRQDYDNFLKSFVGNFNAGNENQNLE